MGTQKNKVKYGLKSVHVAELLTGVDDLVTFGTPTPIMGAVAMSLSPVGETTPFYADNSEYTSFTSNEGYDGDLEIALIPDDFRVKFLGETLDGNSVAIENGDAQSKPFALLYQFEGDVKETRHVLYNVKAIRPSIESKTSGKSIEPNTDKLSLQARPLPGTKNVKAKTGEGTSDAVVTGWFKAVYLPTAVEVAKA